MDDWDVGEITPQTLERFTRKHGAKNCTRIMSVLGKKAAFYEAIRTDLGRELLKDIITKLEILLDKQIEDSSDDPMTQNDKAEYRVLKNLADTWALRISRYRSQVQKLKEG